MKVVVLVGEPVFIKRLALISAGAEGVIGHVQPDKIKPIADTNRWIPGFSHSFRIVSKLTGQSSQGFGGRGLARMGVVVSLRFRPWWKTFKLADVIGGIGAA